MCTSNSYSSQITVLSHFGQCVRRHAALVFFIAFVVFSVNNYVAGQMNASNTTLTGNAGKWTAAYRSLEKALGVALACNHSFTAPK
jgi:hypothetical protein